MKYLNLKVLRCAEFKSQEVISLAFSHDSKYLLAQGGPPDYRSELIEDFDHVSYDLYRMNM